MALADAGAILRWAVTMAEATRCQTPDAIFHVAIRDREVIATVDLPFPLNIDEDNAAVLSANVHNALELVLAPYFARNE